MKKIMLVCSSMIPLATYAHCPCSGKPCDPSNPCGPCAQEHAQSRAKKPASEKVIEQSQPIIKPAPLILSHAAQKHLPRIKAKQELLQKTLAQHLEKISQKWERSQKKLAQNLERIKQKHSGIHQQPKPSAASIIALAQTAPANPVQATPVIQPIVTTPAPVPPPAPFNIPTPTASSQNDGKTELEWTLIKSISAALTPLITAYPTERLIPAAPAQCSFDEQLEQMHTIATFITKLNAKLETLSPEARAFIKTASFAGNSIARMLARNLLSLQSFFESQLAAYKQVKPQPLLVKELKKLTTSCAKEVDALCKELLNA